jgi:hypothetical protein
MVEHTRRYITIENKNSKSFEVVATVVTGY